MYDMMNISNGKTIITLFFHIFQINVWERDIVYLPQVEECSSVHIEKWLGGLYVYKGLLLAVGVYMAWETRLTSQLIFMCCA